MKATFTLDNPGAMDATMTVTMKVAEWQEVAAALRHDGKYVPITLTREINRIIRAAESKFWSLGDGVAGD